MWLQLPFIIPQMIAWNATCDNKYFAHEGAFMSWIMLEPLFAVYQDRARHVIKNTKDIYCENTWALC